jgi:hypothetical protein
LAGAAGKKRAKKDVVGKNRAKKRIRNNHPHKFYSAATIHTTQPSTIKSAPSTRDRVICRRPPPSAAVRRHPPLFLTSAAVRHSLLLSAAAVRRRPYFND